MCCRRLLMTFTICALKMLVCRMLRRVLILVLCRMSWVDLNLMVLVIILNLLRKRVNRLKIPLKCVIICRRLLNVVMLRLMTTKMVCLRCNLIAWKVGMRCCRLRRRLRKVRNVGIMVSCCLKRRGRLIMNVVRLVRRSLVVILLLRLIILIG